MTLSSTTVRDLYSGDGSTTGFATTFIFWNSSELRVTLVSSTGGETVWTEGTQYSVTGGAGAVGTVTASTNPTDYTPASGETLAIVSNVLDHQETSLTAGGSFPSTSVEQELDRMVRRIQQRTFDIDRALILSEASTYSGLTLPDPSAGQLLRWNTAASALENVSVSSSVGATASLDLQGQNLILDDDGDTLFGSTQDDTPKLQIAGADFWIASSSRMTWFIASSSGDFEMTSNTLTALSGSNFVQTDGIMYVGDTANGDMTLGLTMTQSTGVDNDILSLKSADVAHGITTDRETDTYLSVRKAAATTGGVEIFGLTEANSVGVKISAAVSSTPDTTDTSASEAAVELVAFKKSGTTLSDIENTENAVGFKAGANLRWLMKGNGDIHGADTDGATALDVLDDAIALRSIDLENEANYPDSVVPLRSRYDSNRYTREDLENIGLVGPKRQDGTSLWNKTLIESATRGAIFQSHEMMDALVDTLVMADPGFKTKLRAQFLRRGLPTQILDWGGAVPSSS